MALTEISTNGWKGDQKSEIHVCCDVCQETFIGGKYVPLLRRVFLGENKDSNIIYTSPYYIPLKTDQLQQIYIYITDRDGNLASYLNGPISVTVHFKKFPYIS